jgi:hypothetical protein
MGAKMAENLANLHVVGRTADGRMWHTMRSPTGWTPFSDVLLNAGLFTQSVHVVDMACARRLQLDSPIVEGLYVLVALAGTAPRLLFRSSDNGSWSEEAIAAFPTARGVGAATRMSFSQGGAPHAELHLAAVTDNGHLLAAVHPYNATSSAAPQDVESTAGDRGDFRAVALASTVGIDTNSVPLVAVTAQGRLFHSFGSGGSWQPFDEVVGSTVAGKLPADVIDADAVSEPMASSFLAVTGDGHVWLASQFSNGTWAKWLDLETYIGTYSGGGVSGTYTAVADVGTFSAVAAAVTNEGLHVLGVTTNGRLWHQLRSNTMPVFRDVEQVGVGQDVGSFTAVACA